MARSHSELHEMLLRDLTPEHLGRVVRRLTPHYGEAFPLLDAEDSTVLVLWLDVLVAVQHAGPHTRDLVLRPTDAATREERASVPPRRSGR